MFTHCAKAPKDATNGGEGARTHARSWLNRLARAALGGSVALALLTVARPASSAEAIELTLGQAVAAGAERGPIVHEAARTSAAASAFARDPGSSLPAVPTVTVLAGARQPIDRPLGPEVAVTVHQEIAARGLGSARRATATWAARWATSEMDRARVDGASTAALAWIDLLEAQELLRVRQVARADAEKLERLTRARVEAGTSAPPESAIAVAETGSADVALLDGEGRATEARFALLTATGLPLDAYTTARGDLYVTDDSELDEAQVLAISANHPALRAARARAAQYAAEIQAVRAAQGPTFTIGGTAWREGSGDRAAAFIVTVPIPTFDQARHEVGRQSMLAVSQAAYAERLQREIERDVRLALHERAHTREVRAQVRSRVLEPLRKALAAAIAAYAAGTTDLGVVLLARRSSLAAEERLVQASADVWRADVKLAALRGALVPSRGGTP